MTATDHALQLTQAAAAAAADKLGTDLVAFDVSAQLAITDVFLVVTAECTEDLGRSMHALIETPGSSPAD